jgi:hypothetical protein
MFNGFSLGNSFLYLGVLKVRRSSIFTRFLVRTYLTFSEIDAEVKFTDSLLSGIYLCESAIGYDYFKLVVKDDYARNKGLSWVELPKCQAPLILG